MKRFLPYILIVLTVVQLLAPFAIGSGLKVNKANAVEITTISVEVINAAVADTTARIDVSAGASSDYRTNTLRPYDSLFMVVKLNNSDGTLAKPENKINIFDPATQNFKQNNVSTTTNFTSLTANTSYTVIVTVEGVKGGATTILATSTPKTITTSAANETNVISQGSSVPNNDIDGLPNCDIMSARTWGGCIGRVLYYIFFKTTSFVFGLAGKILDFAVMYSVQDTSYRSSFVLQGWGLVRDFCNMFFIFILLYIAFGTILNLHSVKTKEMIINVVIIGLLINFSLFATQIIIDTSNILTRVFYNQKTIVVGVKDPNTGEISNSLGDFGEIKLSEAIVSKVDPQKLIIQASEVSKIPQKGIENDTAGGDISAGSFIIVVILATIVNVVGIIAFISAGIIFIARVIGLWLAMILAPLAFFTYTVPALQDMEMIGWKRWWPETLKLAFLAPIFTFFMYLIVGFMSKGLDVVNASRTTGFHGLSFVVAIVVPFVFIMILLMKAKDIAKSMSGKIGQSITDGISKVGGVALGAGIGGLAMAGRQTLGRLAANASQSNKFKDWAGKSKIGASALKMTSGVASKSFDFRGTKLGGMAGKELGMDLGKAKSGGFAKAREEKIHKEEEFAKKLLDTGDYGMNELTSGNMSARKANRVVDQMKKENPDMTEFEKGTMRARLVGSKGLDLKTARTVADQMSSARRQDRANKLTTGISGNFMTNKIAAAKIRKDPAALAKARDQATILAQIAKQVETAGGEHKKEEHKAPATATHATTAPAPASQTPSGGEHKVH